MGWFSYQIYGSPKQELDTIFTAKFYDYSLDRDINAAKNILDEGLRQIGML